MKLEVINQRVLILSPHTDDGELGCGAIISKLIENNNKVYEVAFSICEVLRSQLVTQRMFWLKNLELLLPN